VDKKGERKFLLGEGKKREKRGNVGLMM